MALTKAVSDRMVLKRQYFRRNYNFVVAVTSLPPKVLGHYWNLEDVLPVT